MSKDLANSRATGRRRATYYRLAVSLLGVAWLGVLAGARPAPAGHGGIVQLNRAAAGPYALSVWTQPSPPRPGPWQVDIAVMQESGVPVADAVVRVRAESVEGATVPVEIDARRDADPLGVRYRASLALGAAGPWRVTVSVAGPAGPGTVSFPVDVEPANWGWWPAALVTAGLVGVAAAAVAWRRRRVAGVAIALVLAGSALAASPAWPHASLVRSSPARRATLTTAPDRVQLWFNEAVEAKFSRVSVLDASGQPVDLADAHVDPEDPKRLTVGLRPLGRGTYRIRFRVLSVDGHVVESEFPFTLR
jgi:methionine-rich copper-binding protein CopC